MNSTSFTGAALNTRTWLTAIRRLPVLLAHHPVWLSLLAAIVFFALQSPHFLSWFNITNVLLQASFFGFLAIGMTLIIISGHIDLSVGSLVGLCAGLCVVLQPVLGLPLAVLAGLAAGVLCGFINGLIIERLGINSLIVTLAAMIGLKGLTFAIVGEESVIAVNTTFTGIGNLRIGTLHLISIVFFVLIAVSHWVMSNTRHGRDAYAIGGNRHAAVNAGIGVRRHVIVNFMVSGFLAALCGLAISANMGAAVPTYGQGYEGWAIAAVALGGTRLTGGSGNILNSLAGVLLLAVLRNGLNLIHLSAHYVLIAIGLALLIALVLDKHSGKPFIALKPTPSKKSGEFDETL
ncbi:ABC transporter permease [Sodalis sp. dw_96]|uniref:ABC transporter permease n=1 Tax=Sodalis sp. dw_96 TaxID=2719794 RepID=UPI001BD2F7BC